MQFVLHFLPIGSEIQRQWRRFKKSSGLVKKKTKNTLRPCTMCDKTCLYLCPTTNVLDKVLRQEGCIFWTKLILYLFRFSLSRRQVKWGQIDVEELINIGNFFRHDLKFVIADTTYIVIER